MCSEQANKFIEKLHGVWKNGREHEFDTLYHSKVTGMLNQTIPLSYADIKNRFKYVISANINREFELKDVLSDGNKIMAFFCFRAFDTVLNQDINAPTMWLLTLEDNRIIHVEILTSLQFDYRKKS